ESAYRVDQINKRRKRKLKQNGNNNIQRKNAFGSGSLTSVGGYGCGSAVHGGSTTTPKVAYSCGKWVGE
ncbi:hypothetical protein Csa_012108, partial [Cucumis sativus]